MPMKRNCWRTSPAIIEARSLSPSAMTRYGRSWAVESRSHIAGMSPVSRKVVPSSCRLTVVSSVLAKQALKFSAQSACSSPHRSVMRCMNAATLEGISEYAITNFFVNGVN